MANQTPDLIKQPVEYLEAIAAEEKAKSEKKNRDAKAEAMSPSAYPWPSCMLHVLGILQEGFRSHVADLPTDLRDCAASLVLTAYEKGIRIDKKWTLEIAGSVSEPVLVWLVRCAFRSRSQWLKEVAYRQVAWLQDMPTDIAAGIRSAMVDLAADGRLNR